MLRTHTNKQLTSSSEEAVDDLVAKKRTSSKASTLYSVPPKTCPTLLWATQIVSLKRHTYFSFFITIMSKTSSACNSVCVILPILGALSQSCLSPSFSSTLPLCPIALMPSFSLSPFESPSNFCQFFQVAHLCSGISGFLHFRSVSSVLIVLLGPSTGHIIVATPYYTCIKFPSCLSFRSPHPCTI